ncbi:MAG: hypothetical protein AB9866_13945 [Syntrophobacteraceae bacterium]
MKKLSSIIGVGVVSMAVALSPAFAQQTKPADPPASGSVVQPKVDEKTPAVKPAPKDEKNLPAKPGADTKGQAATQVKPGADVKAATTPSPKPEVKVQPAVPSKPATDVKGPVTTPATPGADMKTTVPVPAKPSADVKADKSVAAKTAPDTAKAASVSGNPESAAKDVKASSKTKVGKKSSKHIKHKHHAKKVPVTKAVDKKVEKSAVGTPAAK